MIRTLQIHIPRTAGESIKSCVKNNIESYQNLYRPGLSKYSAYAKFPFNSNMDYTYMGHTRISDLLKAKVITKEWCDSCFKFVFVRNTWDRLVSCYNFRLNHKKFEKHNLLKNNIYSFEDFVKFIISEKGLKLKHWSLDNYNQLYYLQWGVNFIGRFERLQEDWKKLCNLIGIKYIALKKKNNTPQQFETNSPKNYREYYSDYLCDLVANYWKIEIERFEFIF